MNRNCSCGSRYNGETKRNAKVRWNEHYDLTKSSLKHLRRTIETPSKHHQPLLYMGYHFKCSQKMLGPGRTQKHHVLFSGNLFLTIKRTLKDQFYLGMVSHRAINDIIQSPQEGVRFAFFSVCLSLIALHNHSLIKSRKWRKTHSFSI